MYDLNMLEIMAHEVFAKQPRSISLGYPSVPDLNNHASTSTPKNKMKALRACKNLDVNV
jgi:hypothetical protein